MKVYMTLFLIVISYISLAQQTISGTVTDINNQPLFGVEVFIKELQKGTSTDENGHYQLNNLPSSSVEITVNYLGYVTQIKTLELKENQTDLNFVLDRNNSVPHPAQIYTPSFLFLYYKRVIWNIVRLSIKKFNIVSNFVN